MKHAGTVQVCKGCGNTQPIDTYAKDNGSATGYSRYCNTCRRCIRMKAELIKYIAEDKEELINGGKK